MQALQAETTETICSLEDNVGATPTRNRNAITAPGNFISLVLALTVFTELHFSSQYVNAAGLEGARALGPTSVEHSLAGGLSFSAHPTTEEIFRARVFEDPLVPVGPQPSAAENAALASVLVGYSKRSGPDDFSALTTFLEKHPKSSWNAALLTGLGFEYYNTAHYSLALDAWARAWSLAKDATEPRAKAVGDRAAGELAYMYARLGRMTDLGTLLNSVEGRVFGGPSTERISGAREALWNMKNHPEVSFRCGPLALRQIKLATDPQHPANEIILGSASTQKGFSLPQVAELSKKVGLNYHMAFREKGGPFVVPSVVHWKVGHYAALVRQVGDRYLVQDPTFGNTVWATAQALEDESSGYFLIAVGSLPAGWRAVDGKEGENIWGKGITSNSDPSHTALNDARTGGTCGAKGMAVPGVHLMLVNLHLQDTPVGYSPPVGPPIRFTLCYNHREAFQPGIFRYSNFGPKWTCDWISYISDNPQSQLADVNYYSRGGGLRPFGGFNTNSLTYGAQQMDHSLLRRIGPANYEMKWGDGSRYVFDLSDGSVGTSRKVFLTRVEDPFGNAATLDYDFAAGIRITKITDSIGQSTVLDYDGLKIVGVNDPFGRRASFYYDSFGRLTNITDVIGLQSKFTYESTNSDFINEMVTPYGITFFSRGGTNTTRWLETRYPDGSRDRVEYNQSINLGIPGADPDSTLPQGMGIYNAYLYSRNTYYWSRTACATAYGDYTKARIYHWLHTADSAQSTEGILESTKAPLEGRVWYNYAGQGPGVYHTAGSDNLPTRVGRVLDDGSTQLYSYGYNVFGKVTNSVDPLGRTFSYIYAADGIDLLEVRMTRAGKNELLERITYNLPHQPAARTDAAGQTTAYAYNGRGQLLAVTNARNETLNFNYDTNGYLLTIDGPLPGSADTVTATYDSHGRLRTLTDVSGYMLTFDYDLLDRIRRATYPDSTYEEATYDRLHCAAARDRAGRLTLFNYDRLRQLTQITDPLGRVSRFDWCRCGALKSLTDPLGRTTSWLTDVQDRLVAKRYSNGSQVNYFYENTSSRLRQVVDEIQQSTVYTYNPDDTLKFIAYANAAVPTPGVTFTYDRDYPRITSITDGIGTTTSSYYPITGLPALGAGLLKSVAGPAPDHTITYSYDELGRRVFTLINGAGSAVGYDQLGRVISITNALGSFTYDYYDSSRRLASESYPNGMTMVLTYGGTLRDFRIQQIAYFGSGTPVSQFLYGWDISSHRIATWSQQTGTQPPDVSYFDYDAAGQLLSGAVTNSGNLITTYGYMYDAAANRLSEQVGMNSYTATYNSLNQIGTTAAPGSSRTNEWDAAHRLVAVNSGNRRTEFTYDGHSRLVAIRQLVNGSEVSRRQFVWSGFRLCEERDAAGIVTKRFFAQGMKVETGANAGKYFYTGDHLGSIRELTDSSGTVRARYAYDPWGRRTRLAGDLDADFGFAGMFWSAEANLALTQFRAYDPELGRWLSRDPLRNAEATEGPNLYVYAANDPVNLTDPSGLAWDKAFIESWRTRLPPAQFELLLAKYENRQPVMPWQKSDGSIMAQPDGDVALKADGDIALRSKGDIALRADGEIALRAEGDIMLRPKGEITLWTPPEEASPIQRSLPVETVSRTKMFPGFLGVMNEFTGAGITILTMTDCNTVNGILGLVRQGKGGLLNVYEDQLMKQIEQYP